MICLSRRFYLVIVGQSIIIMSEFLRRTMSTRRLNLRRQQSLDGDDGGGKVFSSQLAPEQKHFEPHFESMISRRKCNFKR